MKYILENLQYNFSELKKTIIIFWKHTFQNFKKSQYNNYFVLEIMRD